MISCSRTGDFRFIGRALSAPRNIHKYSQKIMKAAQIDENQLRSRVESHLVNYDAFINDDFDTYFIDRAKAIMAVIEGAMEKAISDKGSEQTINNYGVSLEY